jgi:hypothetical protein
LALLASSWVLRAAAGAERAAGPLRLVFLWSVLFTAMAPLGTALTEDQMELMWRHHPEPTLSFDGDRAGKQAAWRAMDRALPLLKPVMSFVVVTTSIAGFQMFGQAFMLTRGGPELSTRGVVQYIYETAFNSYRMGYGAAMSWMLFALIFGFGIVQLRMMRRTV